MKAQAGPDDNNPVYDAEQNSRYISRIANAMASSEKEAIYLNECYENTGKVISEEEFRKQFGDRQELYEQSCRIAEILELNGVKAFSGHTFSLLGLCSGEVRTFKDFRNIVFIPIVAKRRRAKFLKNLEYWLHLNPRSRMWVVTAGERCTIANLRKTAQALHRKISKLNNQAFMKENGISIAFRSTEFGSVERNEDQEATFHVHAHLIVQLDRYLPKAKWSKVLSEVRAFMKTHFKESQAIADAREACKYCVKPSDLEQLHGSELKALYEASFRLHLVQSLGSFKVLMADLKDKEVRPVKRVIEDSVSWQLQPDWNKGGKKRKLEPGDEVFLPPKKEQQTFSNIVAKLAPGPHISQTYEPAVCIIDFDGDISNVMGRWNLSAAREIGREFFDYGNHALLDGNPDDMMSAFEREGSILFTWN